MFVVLEVRPAEPFGPRDLAVYSYRDGYARQALGPDQLTRKFAR